MLLTKGNFVVLNLGLTFAFALKLNPIELNKCK